MEYKISWFDFINNKYSLEDYLETITTTIAIFFFVYLFVIVRSNYFIAFLIVVVIIFIFIYKIKDRYKNLYNIKIALLKKRIGFLKKKISNIVHQS